MFARSIAARLMARTSTLALTGALFAVGACAAGRNGAVRKIDTAFDGGQQGCVQAVKAAVVGRRCFAIGCDRCAGQGQFASVGYIDGGFIGIGCCIRLAGLGLGLAVQHISASNGIGAVRISAAG